MLGSDEGIDFDLALGAFGARLKEIVEDGAAGLACCSEDGVGGHCWGLVRILVRCQIADGGWIWFEFLVPVCNGTLLLFERSKYAACEHGGNACLKDEIDVLINALTTTTISLTNLGYNPHNHFGTLPPTVR